MIRGARRIVRRAPAGAAVAMLFLTLVLPSVAGADISDPTVVDGPSADLVSLDGVAMASDGTGGLVYTKRVGGRTHVFAARLVGGKWTGGQQVDAGQKFDSSWPAIGAGAGGRLTVTWVQQYGGGVQDRMYSAALDPGASRFQAPVPFDLNVGDGTDVSPSLAMDTAGQALLVYRVVTSRDLSAQGVPPGYVSEEVRLARYDGSYWTVAGNLLNRNAAQPDLAPTSDNGPKIAMDDTGNGLVAWQEPDDQFVARVYARRVFASATTVPLPVSPTTWPLTGAVLPLNGPADAISVSMRGLSEGAVAFRQQPSAGSVFAAPRAFVNLLPASSSQTAKAFLGPQLVDGGTDASGPDGALSPPRVSVASDGSFDVALGYGAHVQDGGGGEAGPIAPVRLDDGTSPIASDPVLDRGEDGALAAAWKVQVGGAQGVQVLERRSDGTPGRRLVSSPTAGDLGDLRMSGSGLGDAAIGFRQGAGAGTQIVALDVDAPPSSFTVSTPIDWTRAKRVPITWDPAPSAITGVTYSVVVDDQDIADNLKKQAYTLTAKQLPAGRHTVSIIATDGAGQPTTGTSSDVLVDRTAPTVKLQLNRRTLRITASDGKNRSGVRASSMRYTLGNGHTAKGHRALSYRYRRPGRYRVVVRAADNAGNVRTVRKTVRVR